MSQAVGIRVLDVIKIFFLLLQVTSSSTHVEKHTCSIKGVTGPFWAIPKDLFFKKLIMHQRRKRTRERKNKLKKGEYSGKGCGSLCCVSRSSLRLGAISVEMCARLTARGTCTCLYLNMVNFWFFCEEMKE